MSLQDEDRKACGNGSELSGGDAQVPQLAATGNGGGALTAPAPGLTTVVGKTLRSRQTSRIHRGTRQVLAAVPVARPAPRSFLFAMFPSTRRGIGFPVGSSS
ncbi:unnamed protein product [Urochloa humidicola]